MIPAVALTLRVRHRRRILIGLA